MDWKEKIKEPTDKQYKEFNKNVSCSAGIHFYKKINDDSVCIYCSKDKVEIEAGKEFNVKRKIAKEIDSHIEMLFVNTANMLDLKTGDIAPDEMLELEEVKNTLYLILNRWYQNNK